VRTFAYARPESLEEALDLLERHGDRARVLAGGTDLIVKMRRGAALPEVVVDLKRALRGGISEIEGGLRVGALAVMSDLIEDPRVGRWFPALVEAARVVGSVQIRNRATLAGNICNASPAADTAPALLVYGAVVNLVSRAGRRAVGIVDFFHGPGRTAIGRGELVESIDLPLPRERAGSAFGRITRRRGVDLATVNLCCWIGQSGEQRIACGAVGPRPFLARGEEEMIAMASPISDVRGGAEYRTAMLRVIGRRTMEIARGRLG
jgi:carbon-monoxide dehydrogenase medium subunit